MCRSSIFIATGNHEKNRLQTEEITNPSKDTSSVLEYRLSLKQFFKYLEKLPLLSPLDKVK